MHGLDGRTLTLAVALGLCSGIAATMGQDEERSAPLPLKKIMDVPLSGKATRLDYQSLDPKTHLLFVAHLGDGVVHVFDTEKGKVVADIADVAHVHGVLVVPELGRCYASATGTNEIVSIDEKTLAITDRIPGGVYPDGMAFDPKTKKLYVSDENGMTETVIDTKTQKRVATIELGGEVGNSQHDPFSGHIFVNVQTKDELVEIDPAKDEVVSRTKLEGSDGNHGLLIDADRRLAFVACQGNSKLLVVDMKTMKARESFPIGAGADVLAFDPGPRRLWVSSESGVVSLFEVGTDRSVKKVAESFLAANAHTVGVDPATHRVYFPLKNVGGKPVLRILEPTKDGEGEKPDEGEAKAAALSRKLALLEAQAGSEIQAKKYEEGIAHLQKVLDLVESSKLDESQKKEHGKLAHYDLACALALTGKKAEALRHFERSIELGFEDWKHIEADSDLDSIRDDDAFKAAISKGKAKAGEAGKGPF